MENLQGIQGKLKLGLQKENIVALPQIKSEEYYGSGLIDALTDDLGVAPTMLAALLEVTVRTLENWKGVNVDELKERGKSQRLVALYDFVVRAKKKGVPSKLLLNLLREPLSSEGEEESASPLYFIVNEPSGKFFTAGIDLLIDRFLK